MSDAKEKKSISIPSLEDFLKAGAHFGHRKSRWNPKMKQYIYATRDGVHIIDLVKSMKLLKSALAAIQEKADKGSILLVGTKGQAASMVQKVAEEQGAFYVNNRWPGGLFTNHKMISKSVSNLINMEEQLASGAEGLVKKEQLMLEREVNRLNKLYEGIKFMDRLPSLIIVVDSKLEKNAINEARNVGIPIVALMDTNCDPEMVDHPIPANDDSIKSIKLFLELFAQAIATGNRSSRVVSLRQSHQAKLAQLRNEYAHKVAVAEKEAEAERERMKRLRGGDAVTESKSVRVVKKDSVVVKEKAEKKAAKPAATKKTAAKKTTKSTAAKKTAAKKTSKGTKIADAGFGKRTVNALEAAGVKTVEELAGKSDAELAEMKGIGAVAVKEIKDFLKK